MTFYNGNPKLKSQRTDIPYTMEQVRELQKCAKDIVYFIKTYVKIISLDEGLILFSLYPYQEKMLHAFHDNRFSINLLARQMGKTTTVAAYLLHQSIFNSNYRIAILANKGDTAREILDRLKKMFEELPSFLQPGVIEWNKGSIELANGTKVISAATSSSSIRGQSMNIIYLDELAFIQNDTVFFTSTYPVITSGKTTKVIITSTPNGMNLFYKLWQDAINGNNSFVPNKFLWYEHPLRDEAWKQETLRNISDLQFKQEFDCEFQGSMNTLISGSALQRLSHIPKINEDKWLSVYEGPQEGHNYVASVDVSEGLGGDYSICTIIDITEQPYKQVLVYRNNTIAPIPFTEVVYDIIKRYNRAYTIIENNSIGKIVADSLYYDYEYEELLFTKSNDSSTKVGGNSVGLRQTVKTKSIGCATLKSLIEQNVLIIQDFDTINELSTFVKRGNSYAAENGHYDDIVMSLANFAWLTSQNYFEELADINIRARIRENRAKDEENAHLLFGFLDDGITENY